MPDGERAVLIAAAQNGGGGSTREEITILTGYKRSTRDVYIQRLRHRGYVDAVGDRIVATPEGITALGASFEPLPTGDALRQYWLDRLPEGERKILQVLIESFPSASSREAIEVATGFKRSTRDVYLQRLSTRRLVKTIGRGEVKASETLFDMAVA